MATVAGELAVMMGVLGLRKGDARILDLPPTATRAETTALLGKPERTGPSFDRYEVNGHYLHVEFDAAGHAARLSALLEPV